MPQTDLPIEALLQYQGRNPRPFDFDEYWDEALAELDGIAPESDIHPVDFGIPGVHCAHLWFNSVNGGRIHAKLWQPAKPSGAAILRFHGYSMMSGEWTDGMAYALLGYTVAYLDSRSQGGLSQAPDEPRGSGPNQIIRGLASEDPRDLFMRRNFLDTAQLARVVSQLPGVDPQRMASQGGSQGGALALVCAALHPAIRKVVSGFPFLSDYQRVWEMDLAQGAYGELREFFRRVDPRHQNEEALFTRLGYIDIQNLAPRIEAEVMMYTSLSDTVCPPSTQFAAFNKIRSPKNYRLWPDFGHEYLPGEHDLTYRFLRDL